MPRQNAVGYLWVRLIVGLLYLRVGNIKCCRPFSAGLMIVFKKLSECNRVKGILTNISSFWP